MADVKFTYEGLDIIIRCNKNQKMRDICTYLSTKINVNINSLIFLYGGTQLNLEKTFKELTKENKISILVDKYKNEEICPKCGKILNNDIINEIISSYNKINSSLKEQIKIIKMKKIKKKKHQKMKLHAHIINKKMKLIYYMTIVKIINIGLKKIRNYI